jgi:hypothetical protein
MSVQPVAVAGIDEGLHLFDSLGELAMGNQHLGEGG